MSSCEVMEIANNMSNKSNNIKIQNVVIRNSCNPFAACRNENSRIVKKKGTFETLSESVLYKAKESYFFKTTW